MRKDIMKRILILVVSMMLLLTGMIGASADNTGISITAQPADKTVYAGSSAALSVGATGSGTLKYQWYSSTKNSTSGGVSIAGGTASSYSPPTSAAGTTYYYCLVYTTGTPVSSATTRAAAVTVKPLPKITSQPAGTTAYTGDTVTLSVQASGSGVLTYQWYSIADNSSGGATALAGATGKQYTASTAAAGTTYYYCVVTNTDNTITGTKTASVTSGMAKVVVNAVSTTTPIITSQPSSATVYAGSTAKLSVSAVGSGTLSYQWYKNTSNSTTNATALTGATTETYTVPADTTGSAYYYCVVTNTTGTGVYQTTSNIAAFTVKAPAAITTQPTGTLAFVGDPVTLTVAATGGGALSYQWYSNSGNSTAGGSKIDGATSPSYTPSTKISGTTYYYCVVTNTDSAITGSKTSVVTSTVVKVAVIVEHAAAPTIKTQPVSPTVYVGAAVKLTVTATGTGTLTYQWYSNSESSTETGTVISGATNAVYTVPTATAGTTYYYCTVTNTVTTAAGPESSTTVSSIASVTRKPLPAITTQPAGLDAYLGDTVTLSLASTGSGTLTYQWFSNSVSSVSGSSKITGATKASFSPPTKKVGTTYYFCVVTNTDATVTGPKTAAVTSNVVGVTVKPVNAAAPTITTKPINVTVIAGSPASLSIKATGTGTLSYQWYSNTKNSTSGAAAISGATSDTYGVTPTAAGITYYYCVVTNTDNTMPGHKTASVTSAIVSITVKQLTPVIKQQPVASAVLYKGGSLSLSLSAGGSGTLSYQWYKSTDSNAAGTAIPNATSAKYAVPASAEGTTYYYCIVTNTVKTPSETKSGTAMTNVVPVTVKPLPAITAQPVGSSAYVGDTVTLSVTVTGSGTLTYQWYSNSKSSTSGGRKITGAKSASFSPPTSKASTAYYFCVVTNTDSSITGNKAAVVVSSVVQVVIKPQSAAAPVITAHPVSKTVSAGTTVNLSIKATGTGSLSYQWYSNTKNSTSGATAISGATGVNYSVTPAAAGTVYYYCVVTNTDNTAPGAKTATAASAIAKVTAKAS